MTAVKKDKRVIRQLWKQKFEKKKFYILEVKLRCVVKHQKTCFSLFCIVLSCLFKKDNEKEKSTVTFIRDFGNLKYERHTVGLKDVKYTPEYWTNNTPGERWCNHDIALFKLKSSVNTNIHGIEQIKLFDIGSTPWVNLRIKICVNFSLKSKYVRLVTFVVFDNKT